MQHIVHNMHFKFTQLKQDERSLQLFLTKILYLFLLFLLIDVSLLIIKLLSCMETTSMAAVEMRGTILYRGLLVPRMYGICMLLAITHFD